MLFDISSMINILGRRQNYKDELIYYLNKTQFNKSKQTNQIYIEPSIIYNEKSTLKDCLTIEPHHRIAPITFTGKIKEVEDIVYFQFYLDEKKPYLNNWISDDEKKQLDISSIRFAYPILLNNQIQMIHVIGNRVEYEQLNHIQRR